MEAWATVPFTKCNTPNAQFVFALLATAREDLIRIVFPNAPASSPAPADDDDPLDPCNRYNLVAEYRLWDWWERESQRNPTANKTPAMPWKAIVPFRLFDDALLTDGAAPIEELLTILDKYGALLVYSIKPEEDVIVIWGKVEHRHLEKQLHHSDPEPLYSLLSKNTRPLYQFNPADTCIQNILYGNDRWFYLDLEMTPDNPSSGGGAAALSSAASDVERAEQLFTHELALLKRLAAVVTSKSTNEFRNILMQEYPRLFDLSSAEGRMQEHRLRMLIFLTIMSIDSQDPNDSDSRDLLIRIGGRIIKLLIQSGWPRENHVAYLALRSGCEIGCLTIHSVLSTEAEQLVPVNGHAPKMAAATAHPFLLLPTDSYSVTTQKLSSYSPPLAPILLDTVPAGEWVLTPMEAAVQRQIRTQVIVEHPNGGLWMATEPGLVIPGARQTLLDQYPTRLYLIGEEANPAELFPDLGITYSDEALTFMVGTILVTVYPHIVARSLKVLREAMPEDQRQRYYGNGITWPGNMTAQKLYLQPGLEQLCEEARKIPRTAQKRKLNGVNNDLVFNQSELLRGAQALKAVGSAGSKPYRFWVCHESVFQHNPPDEQPNNKTLIPVTTVHGVQARLVPYQEFGFLMASMFYKLVAHSTEIIRQEWNNQIDRYLLEVWGAPSQLREAFYRIVQAVKQEGSRPSRPFTPAAPPRASTIVILDNATNGSCWDQQGQQGGLNSGEMSNLRKMLPRIYQAHVGSRAIYDRAPGTTEERKLWKEWAIGRRDRFAGWLFEKPDDDKFRSSLHTKEMPASKEYPNANFSWTDYQAEKLYGIGPESLCVHRQFQQWLEKHPSSPTAPDLLYANRLSWMSKKEPADFAALQPPPEPRYLGKTKEGKMYVLSWDRVVQAYLDEQYAQESVDSHSCYWRTQDTLKRFYESTKDSLGDAASAKKKLKGAAATPATLESNRNEMKELLDESQPIDGTLAQRYLRKIRKLDVLSPDILEHSPHLRYYPKLAYHIKPTGKGNSAATGTTMHYPALLCFCTAPVGGEPVAVQRIYLNPHTGNKLGFEDNGKINKAKLSKGKFSEEDAMFLAQPGRLELFPMVFLCEGPETAWSVASVSRHFCVYASFGVANFHRFRAQQKHPSKPTLCICMDAPKPAATEKEREKFTADCIRQVQQLRQGGWTSVVTIQPECGCCKDFDDVRKKHGLWHLRRLFGIQGAASATCTVPADGQRGLAEWNRYV
jgi:hypothetical protein